MIDHIFTRESNMENVSLEVVESGRISDHSLLRIRFTMIQKQIPTNRSGIKADWAMFSREVEKLDSESYCRLDDPDTVIENLIADIGRCRELSTKDGSVTGGKIPLKSWITNYILDSIRIRDKMWKECLRCPDNRILRDRFIRYRNILRNIPSELQRTLTLGEV